MAPKPPPRAQRSRRIGIAVIVVFITVVYGPFLFRTNGFGNLIDADYNLAWQLAVNDAFRHGEILHWNPHLCGGVPGLATPDTRALSPFMVLAVFPELDPVLQIKIEVLFFLLMCALGFFLLAGRMGVHPLFGLFGFFIAAGNGFIVFKVLQGQTIFHPYLLAPLLLAFAWPSDAPWPGGRPGWWPAWLPDPLPVFGGIAAVTLILLEDGVYVYMHTFMLLGGFVAIVAVREWRLREIFLLAIWVVVPTLLCLPRILPAAELLAEHPRLVESIDFMTPKMMFMAYFHPDQVNLYMGYEPVEPHNMWAAYGAYIGVAPIVLAGAAFLKPRHTHLWALAAVALVALLLQAGTFAEWAPWALMRRLPGFTQIRSPYRFSWIFINCVAVLAMMGAVRVFVLMKARGAGTGRAEVLLVLAALLVAVPLGLAFHPLFRRYVKPYELNYFKIHREKPFVQGNLNPYNQYTHTALHAGVVRCWTGLKLPNAVDDGPAAFLVAPPDENADDVQLPRGTAALMAWPNRLVVEVEALEDSRLIIQQNYHPNWRAEAPPGAEIVEAGGVMTVPVAKGKQTVELRYHPRAFRRGLWLALPIWVVFLGAFALWIRVPLLQSAWLRRRRRPPPDPPDPTSDRETPDA